MKCTRWATQSRGIVGFGTNNIAFLRRAKTPLDTWCLHAPGPVIADVCEKKSVEILQGLYTFHIQYIVRGRWPNKLCETRQVDDFCADHLWIVCTDQRDVWPYEIHYFPSFPTIPIFYISSNSCYVSWKCGSCNLYKFCISGMGKTI